MVRYVGDRISFSVQATDERPENFRAFLRTNLGHAEALRKEILASLERPPLLAGAAWRDIPMRWVEGAWTVDVSLTEVGFFKAKPYLLNPDGHQHWPAGPDMSISVHPDAYRSGNIIYCAFTRQFGDSKTASGSSLDAMEPQFGKLDKLGYTVIPPSGKFRDLIREFPHIFDTLGCKILHLLPVNPTPTTYARFGRFGSPYALQDLTHIDPALVEFDRRTTGIDQFKELTYAAHAKGGRVFLDIVINHTGWGSTLQEDHPDWFLRGEDGTFHCPGAWDVVWEDLVELNHRIPDSWNYLAEVFLVWCRRGVDGFRCDAGYKVPQRAWTHIISRVRQEFPETLFLLEGLGGSWEATETLMQEGGMQWAYSELFQNYSGIQVSGYLDHAIRQSSRSGILVHYSETHDNNRLALQGRTWSQLRNALCALTSVSGGYGFTAGVEWLAKDKILVHQSPGLSWGSSENIVPQLKQLNDLLAEHPCFFDGAELRRLSSLESPVYALARTSPTAEDTLLVLVNLDPITARSVTIQKEDYASLGQPKMDLILKTALTPHALEDGSVEFHLAPGAYHALAVALELVGLSGSAYREARARAAWAIKALGTTLAPEQLGPYDWRLLSNFIFEDARGFLGLLAHIDPATAAHDLLEALKEAQARKRYPSVSQWSLADESRALMVPPKHWLVVEDEAPFRATLQSIGTDRQRHVESIKVRGGFLASFAPLSGGEEWKPDPEGLQPKTPDQFGEAVISLERYGTVQVRRVEGRIQFLPVVPWFPDEFTREQLARNGRLPSKHESVEPMCLLTNGIGGMARVCVDLGAVQSKYDCVLGANLHPEVPCDRHIFIKRVRVWINANGFIAPLNAQNLCSFQPGPPARWRFVAAAGAGHVVLIDLAMDMVEGKNTTVMRFTRPPVETQFGRALPPDREVKLIVRFDLEDRSFHSETQRNPGADHHFNSHTRSLAPEVGFEFTPAPDRHVRVVASSGKYHPAVEWSERIAHPIEQSRGQTGQGDGFSPGWFLFPIQPGETQTLVASAERREMTFPAAFEAERAEANRKAIDSARFAADDSFGRRLAVAARAFVVRRHQQKTIIAGYPWFLDWGRDSLICARGLLAAGMVEEVRQLLITFGRFEKDGTLPNIINGEDASNRDTSDAPLWYGIVCEEAAEILGPELYSIKVDASGRTVADVLTSLGRGYYNGASNGVHADEWTGLIWSPKHFTWMDTNYPAGTPREGYPVEIQALWVRLARQLDRIEAKPPKEGVSWQAVAERAESSLQRYFWLAEEGWFADLIVARNGVSAQQGALDTALRSNCLFMVTLGLATGEQAQRCVAAAARHLIIPGALRSLAPLPVKLPLPIYGNNGALLNNPERPYCGRYQGDEDTSRKPAYHNGTAWTWTFPGFCEALAKAFGNDADAVSAAKAYLGSAERLLLRGCVGHLPEVLDGDLPHRDRGCDAQAWGVTEALRVWKMLNQL